MVNTLSIYKKNILNFALIFLLSFSVSSVEANVVYDNGPLVNGPGQGFGGADASYLQTNLGMGTYGFGFQMGLGNRISDDFTVSGNGLQIDNIVIYGYQTGSTTTSTFTGANYRIWNGPPNDPSSSIVYGDDVTNRLVSSEWSNIYRSINTDITASNRPIMAMTLSAGVFLPQGTYWLDYSTSGSLGSGPWAPPITINGQTTTGNALRYTGGNWETVVDNGDQQGFPFLLIGNTPVIPPNPIPTLSEWAQILMMLSLIGLVGWSYRRTVR